MSENLRRILTAAACILMGCAIGVVITYCATTGGLTISDELAGGVREGSGKYTEIMELVDEYFIGEDVDMTQVNDAMASGIISGLGDRWSYYVSAEDYQSYVENINNSYVGVGITIQAKYDGDGSLMGYEVTEVTGGGPAESAGVQPGWVLTAVDGMGVGDISLTETKNLVRGEEGTVVTLTFLVGEDRSLDVQVVRQSFTLTPAEGRLLEGRYGYIIIDNFDAGCAETVKGLVESLREAGAEALIFDVRNNPGGLKSELTDLLDYLLPEGTVFHTVNYNGEESIVTSDPDCVDMPMAVLVNGDSYSAAEYFACALQEYGVGVVVGEKTCGKGYYQVGLTLSDGSCVNLSIGKYYTPNGLSLIDVGVTPDVELPLDEEERTLLARGELEIEDDCQLQTAMDCLNN